MLLFMSTMGTPEDDKNKILEKSLKRIAKGETDRIADIYDEVNSSLYGYILSFLKNPTEAEDVLQDTYVKICQSAGMYKSMGKPMAWILTIARNLSLMKIRSRAKFADIEEYEWDNLSEGTGDFHVEDRAVLTAAMSKLSSEESQIVMLHAVSGMKHREIADMYDMPLATVLSKYNRALKKLKKELTDQGIDN